MNTSEDKSLNYHNFENGCVASCVIAGFIGLVTMIRGCQHQLEHQDAAAPAAYAACAKSCGDAGARSATVNTCVCDR